MIRSTKHILKYQTITKSKQLDRLFKDYKADLQFYIDLLWNKKLPLNINISSKSLPVNIFKHSGWKQIVYKQASEIIRANEKKRKKSKPEIKTASISLDERVFDVEYQDSGEFNEFIRIKLPILKSPHRAETINIPIKYHKHFNKYKDWSRKKNIKLIQENGKYFICLTFEKQEPELKAEGTAIGLDIGYKKLLAISDGRLLGRNIEKICCDVAHRVRGSRHFKSRLAFRNNEINRIVNEIDVSSIKEIVIEDLKNVKKNSKKKKSINTKFMNKLQYWVYAFCISKLERFCQENGVLLTKVDPAYTSQTCSVCGAVHKENRKGKIFKCIVCGHTEDADTNASKVVLHRAAKEPCQESLSLFKSEETIRHF